MSAQPIVMLSTDELAALMKRAVEEGMRAVLTEIQQGPCEILTREQASELLGVHPTVLIRYVAKEALPAVKLGSQWRFRRSEIEAWLAKRAVAPGAHTETHGRKLRALKGGG